MNPKGKGKNKNDEKENENEGQRQTYMINKKNKKLHRRQNGP